jgi:hypothetical protein
MASSIFGHDSSYYACSQNVKPWQLRANRQKQGQALHSYSALFRLPQPPTSCTDCNHRHSRRPPSGGLLTHELRPQKSLLDSFGPFLEFPIRLLKLVEVLPGKCRRLRHLHRNRFYSFCESLLRLTSREFLSRLLISPQLLGYRSSSNTPIN